MSPYSQDFKSHNNRTNNIKPSTMRYEKQLWIKATIPLILALIINLTLNIN